jgi:hypothetical protein
MEYLEEKKEIILNRELNELDKFVLDFCRILDKYVIVSGYVSILFGRSRSTEDVDLLVPKMNINEFEKLWKNIYDNGFECINTDDLNEAFEMIDEYAIRFCRKDKPVPNMEFKVIKDDLGKYSFENKIKVIINKDILFISPLEMQIAYKLKLSSEPDDKDVEDARHIYRLFKEKLNDEELIKILNKLNIHEKIRLLK